MELKRLSSEYQYLFNKAFSLYESAFPGEERRDSSEQARVLNKNAYHFDLIFEGDSFIGVMLYWETDAFVFLEHFVTLPEVRGNGYGAKALDLLKAKNKTILLEIEPPVDQITERRFGFYKRNGFVMNDFYHIQAKYHIGDEDFELKVMSYPKALSNEEYRSFYEYMTREIGIQQPIAKDVVIRPYKEGDNLDQIAKLIYLTDPYIYPNWFDTIEDGISVLKEMINLPTLYNKDNLTVAVSEIGDIAGLVVSKQTPFVEDKEQLFKAFNLAGVGCDARTDFVFSSYYEKMGSDDDGYYIANVAVDPNYQKRGIAGAMVEYITQNHSHCSLECVVANAGSLRIYQRLGFKIDYKYPGVHGIPCYKMTYKG